VNTQISGTLAHRIRKSGQWWCTSVHGCNCDENRARFEWTNCSASQTVYWRGRSCCIHRRGTLDPVMRSGWWYSSTGIYCRNGCGRNRKIPDETTVSKIKGKLRPLNGLLLQIHERISSLQIRSASTARALNLSYMNKMKCQRIWRD